MKLPADNVEGALLSAAAPPTKSGPKKRGGKFP